jgi:hypothetical protein
MIPAALVVRLAGYLLSPFPKKTGYLGWSRSGSRLRHWLPPSLAPTLPRNIRAEGGSEKFVSKNSTKASL